MDIMTPIYDATITRIDPLMPQTIIETSDGKAWTFARADHFLREGQRGILTVKSEADFFLHLYPDQRLRRVPEYDFRRSPEDEEIWLWCWTLDGTDQRFLVKPHFVPGVDGQYVHDETDTIEMAVPPEFSELCESRGLTAEEVLRGFIADLCGLQNEVANPREDGYSSNGSDERRIAGEWFERAYSEGLFSPRTDAGEEE
jgi:hypothetical protein